MLKICYLKVTIPALPEEVRVSINSCVQTQATPEKQAAWCNKRNKDAIYEVATEEEYNLHWAKVRAANAEAQAKREGTASVLQG